MRKSFGTRKEQLEQLKNPNNLWEKLSCFAPVFCVVPVPEDFSAPRCGEPSPPPNEVRDGEKKRQNVDFGNQETNDLFQKRLLQRKPHIFPIDRISFPRLSHQNAPTRKDTPNRTPRQEKTTIKRANSPIFENTHTFQFPTPILFYSSSPFFLFPFLYPSRYLSHAV